MILAADRIITGDGKTVLEGMAIFLEGNKIAAIGSLASLRAAHPEAEVREYPNATIVPGFIDMHVHIGYVHNSAENMSYNDYMAAYLAADYAAAAFSQGVTTMRDVSSPKNLCASLVAADKKGFIRVPRIIHTDAALCFTGGHGWESSVEVDGPWQVRSAIRDALKRGADWIKIMASHRSDTPEYTQEELDAAADEAHRVGRKLAIHAGTQPSIQMAIDAGYDTIEHGTFLTVEQALQMKAKGLVWCPTIVAYTWTNNRIERSLAENNGGLVQAAFTEHHAYFQKAAYTYRDHFEELYKTGVKIVVGTDVVYTDREVTPVAAEMQFMVQYGMPVLEAIQAATKTAAETLGLAERIGEIAVGKEADIAILAGDPVQDAKALEAVQAVFYGGQPVYCK